jgi:hypothetical protein
VRKFTSRTILKAHVNKSALKLFFGRQGPGKKRQGMGLFLRIGVDFAIPLPLEREGGSTQPAPLIEKQPERENCLPQGCQCMKLWTQLDLRLEGIWRVHEPKDGVPLNFRDVSLFVSVNSQDTWLPKRNFAMRHLKLFLAAGALVWSSSAMLRAESMMASNISDVSLPASSSTLAAAPSSSTDAPSVTAAPPVGAASPAVAVAARSNVGDQPQQQVTDPAPAADHHHPAVMGGRPAARHARLRHFCAHPPVRAHTRAALAHTAPPPAPVRLAAPSMPPCSHCWQLVLLGVGY